MQVKLNKPHQWKKPIKEQLKYRSMVLATHTSGIAQRIITVDIIAICSNCFALIAGKARKNHSPGSTAGFRTRLGEERTTVLHISRETRDSTSLSQRRKFPCVRKLDLSITSSTALGWSFLRSFSSSKGNEMDKTSTWRGNFSAHTNRDHLRPER